MVRAQNKAVLAHLSAFDNIRTIFVGSEDVISTPELVAQPGAH